MDIGTGKDLIEFQINNINYHLIDIIEPSEEYNVFRFLKDFQSTFKLISGKGRFPILVGGSGLYLSAVLQSYYLPEMNELDNKEKLEKISLAELKEILINLKPKLHNITDLRTKERVLQAILIEQSRKKENKSKPDIRSLNIGIKQNREETRRKITERLKTRLSGGMIEEVKGLLQKGISHEKLNSFGLEYKFISQHLEGKLTYNDMFQKLNSAIHQFAKRQMTWFRKMEKEDVEINWFHPDQYDELENFVISKLNNE
jgi:tRNA dimethylallyltransferase